MFHPSQHSFFAKILVCLDHNADDQAQLNGRGFRSKAINMDRKSRLPDALETVARAFARARRESYKGAATPELAGSSHQHLRRPEGLKGSTFGPASEGRRLSGSEREAVEKELQRQGLIGKPEKIKQTPEWVELTLERIKRADGVNTWEMHFLWDIEEKIEAGETLSNKQLNCLIAVLRKAGMWS